MSLDVTSKPCQHNYRGVRSDSACESLFCDTLSLSDLCVHTCFQHRAGRCWFLVPVFAPFLGTIVGVMVYQLMVGFHMEGEARDKANDNASIEESVKLNDVTTKDSKDGTHA